MEVSESVQFSFVGQNRQELGRETIGPYRLSVRQRTDRLLYLVPRRDIVQWSARGPLLKLVHNARVDIQRTSTSQYHSSSSFFSFLFAHFYCLASGQKPWSQASSLLLPGSCLQFLSRVGLSNPTARRFFHGVLLTHALALSASQFVRKKKSPRIYASMHSGIRTHETDLYQARG